MRRLVASTLDTKTITSAGGFVGPVRFDPPPLDYKWDVGANINVKWWYGPGVTATITRSDFFLYRSEIGQSLVLLENITPSFNPVNSWEQAVVLPQNLTIYSGEQMNAYVYILPSGTSPITMQAILEVEQTRTRG